MKKKRKTKKKEVVISQNIERELFKIRVTMGHGDEYTFATFGASDTIKFINDTFEGRKWTKLEVIDRLEKV